MVAAKRTAVWPERFFSGCAVFGCFFCGQGYPVCDYLTNDSAVLFYFSLAAADEYRLSGMAAADVYLYDECMDTSGVLVRYGTDCVCGGVHADCRRTGQLAVLPDAETEDEGMRKNRNMFLSLMRRGDCANNINIRKRCVDREQDLLGI